MKGADRYYNLFGKSQQLGRLFLQLSKHARGKCFEIFVLPDGVTVDRPNIEGIGSAVVVYGVVRGQRGWTEEYGWIHEGKWKDDFLEIVRKKDAEREQTSRKDEEIKASQKKAEEERISNLLESY